MKNFTLIFICGILLFFNQAAHAQIEKPTLLPSDQSLMSLAKKHVKSTIRKTTTENGEVFLQRDLTDYLTASSKRSTAPKSVQLDHGHDHKDDMLLEFLNLPQPSVATYRKYFGDAAREFNVPVEILMATAQVQSNWAQVSESLYGSWGVMGIIENHSTAQISQAASLLNVPAENIKRNAKTNIRAAAALLAEYQKNRRTTPKIESWFESLQDLTGLTDREMKHELAARIFELIKAGSKSVTLWDEIISIKSTDISVPSPLVRTELFRGAKGLENNVDYTSAIPNFTPCNFNARPTGSEHKYYFVHYVGTGTYQGAISWFKDCTSEASSHYIVRNSDGQVSQLVAESARAWTQGVKDYNDQGIGVEHEAIATNLAMWDSEPMLISAGNLASDVCTRNNIPKIRRSQNGDRGIYGHNDVRSTDCPNLTQARWDVLFSKIAGAKASAATPFLNSVMNPGSGDSVKVSWQANRETNLKGYRLYYANDDLLTSWTLAADENMLTKTMTSVILSPSQFINVPVGDVYHFKLTAIVSDNPEPDVESNWGDVYSRSSNTTGEKVLIVDGFYKSAGSYPSSSHTFVTNYFRALRDKGSFEISSASNERIHDGTFDLKNYDLVVWFIGDESSAGVIFSTAEKNAIKGFLENGGKLLFSSSEAAYNLGRSGAAALDLAFMNNYLKSNYVHDGAISFTPATGIAGTPFEGLNMPFGITYVEDYPDAIKGVNGGIDILKYNSTVERIAGVAYKGPFGSSTKTGALIYLGFTLETARDTTIASFMERAIQFYNAPVVTYPPTANPDEIITQTGIAKRVNVLANDSENGSAIKPSSLTITNSPTYGNITKDTEGNVTYISNVGFTGTDYFDYTVDNVFDQTSDPARVTITVGAISSECDPEIETDDLHPKRDMRGAWVASVSNLDWPSSRSLTTAQQQQSLIRILDTMAATGINTVFLQVRPEGDALYSSTLEPWSYWLTGAQGTAPSPFYDPLEFAIVEAHKRGMELHAWINPFRAKQSTPTLAPNHVAALHPEWTFVSGNATLLDPGIPEVRQHITNVVADIATRYNVDGIHFDDYFYPYAGMTGQDNGTYAAHNPTNISTIQNWRRNNVNMMVASVYDTIAAINTFKNSNVIFGVSPFGIYKSGVPAGIVGTSSYDAVYCDPIAWMAAGKVDYIAPQLYWKITGPQDYLSLSKWWNDQGKLYNRHVYPGLAIYRLTDASNWALNEITDQIAINRRPTHDLVKGQILFRAANLMSNSKGLKTDLQTDQFKYKSFSPPMPWKDVVCPNPPNMVRMENDSLRWEVPVVASDGDFAKKYVVYIFANATEALTNKHDGKKIYDITYDTKVAVPVSLQQSYFVVTSLDKNNNESIGAQRVVLPVTGLDITAKLVENKVTVTWTTLSEINTKEFEVEKSSDGVQFRKIATRAAEGNSHTGKRYSTQDVLDVAGIYFYRIKGIDLDGKTTYSEIKTVHYGVEPASIKIGPNPFRNSLTITNLVNVKRVDLIDFSGRLVLTKQVQNGSTITLETSKLPAGIYQLKTSKTDGSFITNKVIKL